MKGGILLAAGLVALGLLGWTVCGKKAEADLKARGHEQGASRGGQDQAKHSGNVTGAGAVVPADRCGHGAPKSLCFICDASLRDKGRLWCKEHGRYEDRCFLCHPEIKEEGRAYCEKHFLYEDECFLCRPGLKSGKAGKAEAGAEAAGSAEDDNVIRVGADLYCKEHDLPESECAICHPELVKGMEAGKGMKIRFPSSASAGMAGIETGTGEVEEGAAGPSFLGRVAYNQNQFAHISALAGGVIQRVLVDFGTEVKKGQPLVEIASPDIAEAKTSYLSALSELDLKEGVYQREQQLADKQVSSRQERDQARAEYRRARNDAATARQRLRNLGFSDAEISALDKDPSASSTLRLRAPFAGTIVERKAVVGEVVSLGTPLFSLADLSTMWLELSAPADAHAALKVGDPVAATFDGLPGMQVPGEIIWVSPAVDPATRMITARALVRNPDGVLKDGLFGKVRLPKAGKSKRVGLPSGAVQRFDGEDYVFVKLEEDLYEMRKVRKEEGDAGRVSILRGLQPEEDVVLAGSFLVKSEFLKSRLGAGCTDH
jgi:cobalt-zinc-cadmium efflux system membrane fusion protein